jgi:amino acid adenylation domain-containing protein
MSQLFFSKAEVEHTIPDRFERIVEQFPRRTAVKSETGEWKYAELNAFANRLAQAISIEIGTGQEPVAFLFGHESAAIPAILGILKAGRAYVALNPDHPASINKLILEDLQTRLLITNSQNLSLADPLANGFCSLLNVDDLEMSLSDKNPDNQSRSAEALEAVFFTSGTSGKPKGVARSHRFILHRIWLETNDYQIQPDDNFSLIHNFNFGASQTDIFNALLNGAVLSLFDIKNNGLDRLIHWLKEQRITFFHVPTDLMRQFIESLKENDYFSSLRQVTPSGRLYWVDVERFRKHLPDRCTIIQRLASTETGMITRLILDQSTVHKTNVIPVGYAVEDKEILILDEAGEPLGPNSVGEIAVISRYLASGYWKKPDLTEKVFLKDPRGSDRIMVRLGDYGRMRSDGCLELVGRKDSRVKIRGYRVELGEIEATLLNLEGIKAAVVVPHARENGESRLVAYLVPVGETKISASSLRKGLAEKLPEYMIPSLFIPIEKLPLTDRGKLDLASLPDPSRQRPELDASYTSPRTATECTLAGIWSDTLMIDYVGIFDNFFELGGHSLLASRVVARVNAAFKVDLPLRSLFDNPTISGFALALEKNADTQSNLEDTPLTKALHMLGYS